MGKDEIGALITELKSLKLRESLIIAKLEAANKRNIGDPINGVNAACFVQGDRVKIINRIRKPKNWPKDRVWDEQMARKATVTYVDTLAERVYYVTDNGVETWRNPTNLKHN